MQRIMLVSGLMIAPVVAWRAPPGLISEVIYPPAGSDTLWPASRPQVRATEATTAPAVDGRFDDPCWQAGEWQTGFLLNDGSGRKAQAQTEFKVAFDPTHLYLAVRCLELQMAQLKSFWGARHDEAIFNDDCVEFWFDVNNLHQRSYHLILSQAGGRWDGVETQQRVDDPQAATVGVKKLVTDTDLQWDTRAVSASQKADGYWTMEVGMPVADLGAEEILPGEVWGFNLGRERWADGPEFSSLSGVFQFPLDRYAELHFGKPQVKVHLEGTDSLGLGDNRIGLLLENPTPQPQRYTVTLEATSRRTQRLTRQVRLAAGSKRREAFVCRFAGAEDYRLQVTVQNADGEKVFRRELTVPHSKPVELLLRSRNYYQGEKATGRVSLHVGNLTWQRSRLRLAVVDETGRERIAGEVPRLRAASLQLGLALGRLKEPGFYRLRLQLLAADGTETGQEDQPIRIVEGPVYEEARR